MCDVCAPVVHVLESACIVLCETLCMNLFVFMYVLHVCIQKVAQGFVDIVVGEIKMLFFDFFFARSEVRMYIL